MTTIPFPGGWRYHLGALAGWLIFLVLIVASYWGRSRDWPFPARLVLALAPSMLAGFQFLIAWRLVEREDEYIRSLFAKRMLVAAAAAIVVAIGWSGMESLGAPHLPAWLLYPFLWGLFGLVTPLVARTTS